LDPVEMVIGEIGTGWNSRRNFRCNRKSTKTLWKSFMSLGYHT